VSVPGLVSIITTYLNAEKFIEAAIDSAFAQTYKDWELLLIDDGSTNGSSSIGLHHPTNNPDRVTYLQHPQHLNRGISASLNLGIQKAKGEYLAFLDADDVWLEHKLERQVELLATHPRAAMIYGATHYWYGWTGRLQDIERDLFIATGFDPDEVVEPPSLLTRLLRKEVPVPCPSGVMVRRDVATELGGFEESFKRAFTDQVFFAKVFLHRPVLVASDCWFRYRRHTESAISRAKESGYLRTANSSYLEWLETYLRAIELTEPNVWNALAEARFKADHPTLARLKQDARYRAARTREFARRSAQSVLPQSIYAWLKLHYRGNSARR